MKPGMIECVAIWRDSRKPTRGLGQASKVLPAEKARQALAEGAAVVFVLPGDVGAVTEGAGSGETTAV